MFRRSIITCAALSVLAAGVGAQEKTVMVGGAAMYPSKDIIDNAMNSKDHTTLVAAVKAAGLIGTLKGTGPFTVFAPTNAAFDQLADGVVEMLLKPEHLDQLKAVLTYHVVPGRLDSKMLIEWAHKGHGTAELKTVSGESLGVVWKDGKLWLRDGKGMTAAITTADVYQSNGVIHVIDSVLMSH
jgi:uncharacterized surface protein with fasciclin (FAS1) repeats